MPTIQQSAMVNMNDWQPLDTPRSGAHAVAVQMDTDPTKVSASPARSPYMLTSMPIMASTADAFQRQFYRLDNLPTHRILPAKRKAGS